MLLWHCIWFAKSPVCRTSQRRPGTSPVPAPGTRGCGASFQLHRGTLGAGAHGLRHWTEFDWSLLFRRCKEPRKSAQCGSISSSHAAWSGSSWRSRSDWWFSGEHGECHRDCCAVLDQAASDDWSSVTGLRSTTLVSENKEVDALDALLDLNVLEEDPLQAGDTDPWASYLEQSFCVPSTDTAFAQEFTSSCMLTTAHRFSCRLGHHWKSHRT